jgi:hypothetical protein
MFKQIARRVGLAAPSEIIGRLDEKHLERFEQSARHAWVVDAPASNHSVIPLFDNVEAVIEIRV